MLINMYVRIKKENKPFTGRLQFYLLSTCKQYQIDYVLFHDRPAMRLVESKLFYYRPAILVGRLQIIL